MSCGTPTSSRSCCGKGERVQAFVTGGTGLLGRHLVDVLLTDGWEVSVLTRDESRAKDLEARGARLVPGDVTRPRFHAAIGRADVVFHAAAWFEIGTRDVRRMLDVNVTGTANVLSIARKEGVGRVVYTSTAGLFAPAPPGSPATESSTPGAPVDDPYVVSKLQAYRLAVSEMHAGLPLTIVMPAAVFGPHDTGQLGRSLALLTLGRLKLLPKGFGVTTWTHAGDVAHGHLLAATKGRPGERYLLGDRVLPFVDFFRMAAEAAGVRPPRAVVPMPVARLAARISEARAGFAGQTPLLSRASLDLAALDVAVDAAKARRDLGWSPRPLEDRVKETMAWYVDRYRVRRAPLPIKASGAFA